MKPSTMPRAPTWLLVSAFALTLCAACGQTELPAASPSSPVPPAATPTGIPPTLTLTADAAATLTVADIFANIRSMGATKVAAEAQGALTTIPMEQTALARPTPSHRVFPTWPTSAPQPTPITGPQSECSWGVHDGFFENSCWVVLLDNKYLYLFGGYLYNIRSSDISDETMGAFVVFDGATGRYPTPQQLGPVRIVAVDGARVTLQTVNTQPASTTFIFDLTTRQWLTPAPSPIPSHLPTP